MAKIKYRQCDICGHVLDSDDRRYNIYRIFNRLFNRIDICDSCFSKIKHLSIDKKEEEKCWNEIFNNKKDFSNEYEERAYYQGAEDAIAALSHNRLLSKKY